MQSGFARNRCKPVETRIIQRRRRRYVVRCCSWEGCSGEGVEIVINLLLRWDHVGLTQTVYPTKTERLCKSNGWHRNECIKRTRRSGLQRCCLLVVSFYARSSL